MSLLVEYSTNKSRIAGKQFFNLAGQPVKRAREKSQACEVGNFSACLSLTCIHSDQTRVCLSNIRMFSLCVSSLWSKFLSPWYSRQAMITDLLQVVSTFKNTCHSYPQVAICIMRSCDQLVSSEQLVLSLLTSSIYQIIKKCSDT